MSNSRRARILRDTTRGSRTSRRLAYETLNGYLAQEREAAVTSVFIKLLQGELRLLGKPIALAWPDGLPDGFDENSLQDFIQKQGLQG